MSAQNRYQMSRHYKSEQGWEKEGWSRSLVVWPGGYLAGRNPNMVLGYF